jgi:hypothetical protein
MKRKLIELEQKYLAECDNPSCDHKVENETGDPYVDIDCFLNTPCPKCGENLLTEDDLYEYKEFIRLVKWANKWFSWMAFLLPGQKTYKGEVHIHGGTNIKEIND